MKTIKIVKQLKTTVLLILALGVMACGGGDGDGPMTDDDNPDFPPIGGNAPSAATLIFPEENKECAEGTIISDTQSRVTFQWNASEKTDSYEVSLRNLNTNSVEITPSTTNQADIVLTRGAPYEWFVISKADGVQTTAESPKWKFYNQGLGTTHYAPFPAEAVNPKQGQTVGNAGSITLQWNTSDVDNDIAEYEVVFGTSSPPTSVLSTTVQNSANTNVVSGQTYYWRVTTIDSQGNTSQSAIFEFRVL